MAGLGASQGGGGEQGAEESKINESDVEEMNEAAKRIGGKKLILKKFCNLMGL